MLLGMVACFIVGITATVATTNIENKELLRYETILLLKKAVTLSNKEIFVSLSKKFL
jgi:hypothetical protein